METGNSIRANQEWAVAILVLQAREDILFHVFPAVAQEKIQFLGRRQGAGLSGLGPDLPAPSSAGRFPQRGGIEAPGPQLSQEHPDLGGFAGPVDALDDEKKALLPHEGPIIDGGPVKCNFRPAGSV